MKPSLPTGQTGMSKTSHGVLKIGIYRKVMTLGFSLSFFRGPQRIRNARSLKKHLSLINSKNILPITKWIGRETK